MVNHYDAFAANSIIALLRKKLVVSPNVEVGNGDAVLITVETIQGKLGMFWPSKSLVFYERDGSGVEHILGKGETLQQSPEAYVLSSSTKKMAADAFYNLHKEIIKHCKSKGLN